MLSIYETVMAREEIVKYFVRNSSKQQRMFGDRFSQIAEGLLFVTLSVQSIVLGYY